MTVPTGNVAVTEAGHYLSKRELDILLLLAEGLTNVQIGKVLHISKHTVAQHVAAMLKSTSSRSRAHLVGQAYQHGILAVSHRTTGQLEDQRIAG